MPTNFKKEESVNGYRLNQQHGLCKGYVFTSRDAGSLEAAVDELTQSTSTGVWTRVGPMHTREDGLHYQAVDSLIESPAPL